MAAQVELHVLIDRAQHRDPTAISEIYHRYASQILRYLYLRVGEYELAQDLTQEVFIKVIKGIGRFEYRDEKAFYGWLYTIAGNVLQSHRRRLRLTFAPLSDSDHVEDQRSAADVLAITERMALQQAFDQLTYDQQQVLNLRFFSDLSNSEIADLLRRTEGSVKAIQYRALQSLQRIMRRESDEPEVRHRSATIDAEASAIKSQGGR